MSALRRSINELRTNPEQWTAFTTEGHCVVLAPPGSGKTKLLATRAAYDLANRIPRPHGAACITLTNPAADELRRRIDVLGADRRSTFFVGTVHSFALTRIVLPFAGPAGMGEVSELKIASQAARDNALRFSIEAVFPHATTNDLRLARSTIERHRKLMATEEEWRMTGPELRDAARRYEARLRAKGLMDFDDVISYAVSLVEEHEFVRHALTARYSRLYVDEYQDLAPGLDRLVQALCFDYRFSSDLFAVGDPDQAVFGWTGTRPQLLNDLAASSFVTPVRLQVNYRCGTEIIARAQRLLTGRHRVSGERVGGLVRAHHEPGGFSAQTNAAARLALEFNAHGTPLHEIVVLCSTRDECADAATALREAGVPAFVRGSEYDATPVTLLIEALAAWAVLGQEASGHRLGELLRRWRDSLGDQWSMKAATRLVSQLMAYKARSAEPAAQFLDDVLACGLQAAMKARGRSDEAAAVADMAQALTQGGLFPPSVADLAERARNVDRVQVTTTSSGKGLEFDIVLLLGADEGKMPHFSSPGDPAKLDEDKRKFYVSITRAREQVHIFYSGFTVDRYGRKRRDGASRFLQLLQLTGSSRLSSRPPARGPASFNCFALRIYRKLVFSSTRQRLKGPFPWCGRKMAPALQPQLCHLGDRGSAVMRALPTRWSAGLAPPGCDHIALTGVPSETRSSRTARAAARKAPCSGPAPDYVDGPASAGCRAGWYLTDRVPSRIRKVCRAVHLSRRHLSPRARELVVGIGAGQADGLNGEIRADGPMNAGRSRMPDKSLTAMSSATAGQSDVRVWLGKAARLRVAGR